MSVRFCSLLLLLAIQLPIISSTKLEDSMWTLSTELDKTAGLTSNVELSFVSQTLTNMVVQAGESLELRCEAMGVPQPMIRWSHNGKPIEGAVENILYEKLHNVGKLTLQNGITVSKIVIPCASKHDRGKYKCEATNGHLSIQQEARVSVAGPAVCKEQAAVPYIALWTEARFENEGNSVQLLCRSQPGATIAWYNQDRELLNSHPEFEVFPNGDLMIKRAEWKHMGSYTCVASNELGEDRIEAFVYPTALSEKDDPTADSETK